MSYDNNCKEGARMIVIGDTFAKSHAKGKQGRMSINPELTDLEGLVY